MPEKLSGVIERITFHNLDNGYCVLRVQARGHRDLVTVVGHCSAGRRRASTSTATGDWVTDRTHGLQFKADELKTTPPHTAEGIAKYLGSGLVKGIGPRYAEANRRRVRREDARRDRRVADVPVAGARASARS